jgi:hypothetical protein
MIREKFRFFSCPLCDKETAICSRCDRGQRYCTKKCSQQARRESVGASGRRYQQTEKGKAKHAARQAAYQLRQEANQLRQAANQLRLRQAACELCQVLASHLCQLASHLCELAERLQQPSSGRPSEKDDASGYTNAEWLMHTLREDAEADSGDALSRRPPQLRAQMSVRCCLCGARWRPRPP